MTQSIPVVTIDGPSGSGKGTVSLLLAKQLGWHYLDSGTLYRVLACAVLRDRVSEEDEASIVALIPALTIQFVIDDQKMEKKVILDGVDITEDIRTEQTSQMSSKISTFSGVRQALVARQHSFRQAPGLVTDGRDMGTVIFPDANLKIYLTASAKVRAERRFEQLKNKGFGGTLAAIQRELEERDKRDQERTIAPLKPAVDAHIVDSSTMSIDEVLMHILGLAKTQQLYSE
jgi:cytidylate kinase